MHKACDTERPFELEGHLRNPRSARPARICFADLVIAPELNRTFKAIFVDDRHHLCASHGRVMVGFSVPIDGSSVDLAAAKGLRDVRLRQVCELLLLPESLQGQTFRPRGHYRIVCSRQMDFHSGAALR